MSHGEGWRFVQLGKFTEPQPAPGSEQHHQPQRGWHRGDDQAEFPT
jgi:hypothetical protein